MKMPRVLFVAFTIAAAALMPAAAAAQVRGNVTNAATNEPVAGALVWLTGRTIHMTRSDSSGAYEFRAAPAGSYCIRVDSPGYEGAGICIRITAHASMIIDLPLAVRPVAIEPLVVVGKRGMVSGRAEGGEEPLRASLATQDLSLSGTRTTALAAAQLGDLTHMPAADPSGGGRPHALYVWGSSAERGRVLLDGASLNAPLHLGALLPPLDPAVVSGANVHSGGISPRFDGGTSYIMDFRTRAPADQSRTWGQLDLLAGRIGGETPLGARGGIVVSARRVNDEVIDGLLTSKFGYGYADALARADLSLGNGNDLHVTALTTSEAVSIPRDLADDRASWRNHAATLVWRNESPGDARSATLTVSRGVADLPLLSAVGGHLEASLDRLGGLAQRRWTRDGLTWNAGAEVEHLIFRRRSRATQDPVTGLPGSVECTAALPCTHSHATLLSTFGEFSLSPARGVQASLGTRAMYDINAQRAFMLPRVSLTVLPSRSYSVTVAAGRFSQAYVRESTAAPDTRGVDIPVDVDVARATHVELGVARHEGASHIRAGAYLRRHAGAGVAGRARTVPGADLSIEQATPIGTLSFAYSISGRPRADNDSIGGIQQLVTGGFSGTHGRWQLDVSAAYGSGLPLTSIVLEQPVDAEILLQPGQPGTAADPVRAGRSYMRLDATVGMEWRLGRDDHIRIMPYARIINALGQRESLFYFQDGDVTTPPHSLASLPAVPMIGLRWQF